jgi:hypothetical protein
LNYTSHGSTTINQTLPIVQSTTISALPTPTPSLALEDDDSDDDESSNQVDVASEVQLLQAVEDYDNEQEQLVLHQKRLWTPDWDDPVTSESTWWPLLGAAALTAVAFQSSGEEEDAENRRKRQRTSILSRLNDIPLSPEQNDDLWDDLYIDPCEQNTIQSTSSSSGVHDTVLDRGNSIVFTNSKSSEGLHPLRCQYSLFMGDANLLLEQIHQLEIEKECIEAVINSPEVVDYSLLYLTDRLGLVKFDLEEKVESYKQKMDEVADLRRGCEVEELYNAQFTSQNLLPDDRGPDRDWQRQVLDLWSDDESNSKSNTSAPPTYSADAFELAGKTLYSSSVSITTDSDDSRIDTTLAIAASLPEDFALLEVEGLAFRDDCADLLPSSIMNTKGVMDDCLLASAGFGVNFTGDHCSLTEDEEKSIESPFLVQIPTAETQGNPCEAISLHSTGDKSLFVDTQSCVINSKSSSSYPSLGDDPVNLPVESRCSGQAPSPSDRSSSFSEGSVTQEITLESPCSSTSQLSIPTVTPNRMGNNICPHCSKTYSRRGTRASFTRIRGGAPKNKQII